MRVCDEKFIDEDLSEEGNEFAAVYFDFKKGDYLSDYEAILGEDGVELYHVKDTWANFDRLKPVLDKRFSEWRAQHG